MSEHLTGSSAKALLSYENRTLLVLTVVGGVAGIDILAMSFLSPFLAPDLGLNDAQIGVIVTGQLIAWSVGAIITATLSDRQGRRRIFLVIALVLFALLSAGSALATSFATLLAARLLVGLAEGPVLPMQSAIMNSASSPYRRGVNLGVVQTVGSQLMGAIAGPVVLVWITLHLGGWRHAFLIAGAPALVMAFLVHITIRESDRGAYAQSAQPLSDTVLAIVRVRNIQLSFLIGVCAVAWYGTILTFLPLWVIRVLHLSPGSMAVVMSSIGAAGAVGAFVVTALSDRFGRRPTMAVFALVGAGLPLGLLNAPADLLTVSIIVFTGGLFLGIFPLFFGIVPMESVDARSGVTALGLVMGCAQIVGGLVGPLLGGVLSDTWSLAAPFWMTVGLATCAAFISLFLDETAPRLLEKVAGSR